MKDESDGPLVVFALQTPRGMRSQTAGSLPRGTTPMTSFVARRDAAWSTAQRYDVPQPGNSLLLKYDTVD